MVGYGNGLSVTQFTLHQGTPAKYERNEVRAMDPWRTVCACLMLISATTTAAGQSVHGRSDDSDNDPDYTASQRRPNILFIMSDDQGWNDVGWNNPAILTPNLDSLAYGGVILNQSYVQPMCTPSRAALMTGIYPFKTGMQSFVVRTHIDEYLPLKFKLLPEYLKELHYSTHLVGKWHLGHCRVEATPTYRGFDSFLGCYSGAQDYFTKVTDPKFAVKTAYDLRRNFDVVWNSNDIYTTTLYSQEAVDIIKAHDASSPFYIALHYTAPHEPLQVPSEYLDLYPNIRDKERRAFMAMVTAMDEGVGDVVQALKDRGIMDNTIIVFTSDNGAMTTGGSNHPLRGNKRYLFEGGTRVPAFIYSPRLMPASQRVSNELFHITDWLPTLLAAAGLEDIGKEIDGMNQWATLSQKTPGKRFHFVYNIFGMSAALRFGRMKLIEGTGKNAPERETNNNLDLAMDLDLDLSDILDHYNVDLPADLDPNSGLLYANSIIDLVIEQETQCRRLICDCHLFDLEEDPTETVDLSVQHSRLVSFLYAILSNHKAREVEPVMKIPGILNQASFDPIYNNTVSYGWC